MVVPAPVPGEEPVARVPEELEALGQRNVVRPKVQGKEVAPAEAKTVSGNSGFTVSGNSGFTENVAIKSYYRIQGKIAVPNCNKTG